jgi:TolA-binding protein
MRPDDWTEDEERLAATLQQDLDAVRARHLGDPPLTLLRAADADALPEPLQSNVAGELARHQWQRALVEGAAEAETGLDRADEDRLLARIHVAAASSAPARVLRFARVWQPVLALAAVAVLVTAVVLRMRAPQLPASISVTPAAPTTSTPTAAPSFVLTLDKPDVKLTASALVRRSTGRNAKFVDDVAPALNAYRAGDYQAAASAFVRVQPQYPDAVEIPFYLGVTRLFLDDVTGAVAALEAARRVADDTFSADVSWYLAAAQERAGNRTAARTELETLCGGQSNYAARACAAASKMK